MHRIQLNFLLLSYTFCKEIISGIYFQTSFVSEVKIRTPKYENFLRTLLIRLTPNTFPTNLRLFFLPLHITAIVLPKRPYPKLNSQIPMKSSQVQVFLQASNPFKTNKRGAVNTQNPQLSTSSSFQNSIKIQLFSPSKFPSKIRKPFIINSPMNQSQKAKPFQHSPQK